MTKSFLAVIAEAAGLDSVGPKTPQPALPAAPTPASMGALSLEDQINRTWSNDAEIRTEFRSFESYAAYMRANASGLVKHYGRGAATTADPHPAEFNEQQLDIAGYVAQLEKKNGSMSGSEKSAIEGYAATWLASSDIRAEFKTFECYAAYMRAKASGLIKHYGRGKVR